MNFKKNILGFVSLLIGSILLGVFLLWLVFLMPTDGMFQHARKAVKVFSIEKSYPLMADTEATQLDNWTDALMLMTAFYEKEDATTLEKALDIYYPTYASGNPTESMIFYSLGKTPLSLSSYARYWHGYLVILKPLLSVTGYLEIRGINRILQPLLMMIIAAVLWRKWGIRPLIPLVAAYLFMRPETLAFSMQFSTIFYISMLAVLGMVLFYDKISKGYRFFYYFLITGIVTNYIDFLTYPVASLGIPLGMWLCLTKEKACLPRVRQILLSSLCWGFGYSGMWIGKWVAGSILLKHNVIADALKQAQIRSSADVETGFVSRGAVVLKNLQTGTADHPWLFLFAIAAVLAIGIWKTRGNGKKLMFHILPFLLVAGMPVVWYSVLRNHSFLNHWFTYRALAVSVFAVAGMGMTYNDY